MVTEFSDTVFRTLRSASGVLTLASSVTLLAVSSAMANPAATAAHDKAAAAPQAEMSPRDVVVFQMQNLGQWHEDPSAAERVFSRASPANKAVTGPLDNFRRMVESPSYDVLLQNEGWLAGQAVERNGAAAVLVSLMDRQDRFRAFRFYLSWVELPAGGQWMTDAVIAVTPQSIIPPANGTL